jgi:hypothetical protein
MMSMALLFYVRVKLLLWLKLITKYSMVKHTHWYEYMEVVMGYSSELMVIIYTKIVESYQVILFMDPEKNSDRLRSI